MNWHVWCIACGLPDFWLEKIWEGPQAPASHLNFTIMMKLGWTNNIHPFANTESSGGTQSFEFKFSTNGSVRTLKQDCNCLVHSANQTKSPGPNGLVQILVPLLPYSSQCHLSVILSIHITSIKIQALVLVVNVWWPQWTELLPSSPSPVTATLSEFESGASPKTQTLQCTTCCPTTNFKEIKTDTQSPNPVLLF